MVQRPGHGPEPVARGARAAVAGETVRPEIAPRNEGTTRADDAARHDDAALTMAPAQVEGSVRTATADTGQTPRRPRPFPATGRRALVRGAASSVPSFALGAAAPALAVSACRQAGPQGFPASATSSRERAIESSGSVSQGTAVFDNSSGGSGSSVHVDADPVSGATYTVTVSSAPDLVAGRTYRPQYTNNIRSTSDQTMTAEARAGSTPVPGSAVTANRSGTVGLRVDTTFTMPAPAPNRFSVVRRISNPTAGSSSGDDIRIDNVSLTRS